MNINLIEVDKHLVKIDKKLQKIADDPDIKTHGMRSSAFKVECHICKEKVKKAFCCYDTSKGKFLCFNCFNELF